MGRRYTICRQVWNIMYVEVLSLEMRLVTVGFADDIALVVRKKNLWISPSCQ